MRAAEGNEVLQAQSTEVLTSRINEGIKNPYTGEYLVSEPMTSDDDGGIDRDEDGATNERPLEPRRATRVALEALVAIWRTLKDHRVRNYGFNILDDRVNSECEGLGDIVVLH